MGHVAICEDDCLLCIYRSENFPTYEDIVSPDFVVPFLNINTVGLAEVFTSEVHMFILYGFPDLCGNI
jgi:hypothetical protein